jgi:hypothetical protein
MSATRRTRYGSIGLYVLISQTVHQVETAYRVQHHPKPEEATG